MSVGHSVVGFSLIVYLLSVQVENSLFKIGRTITTYSELLFIELHIQTLISITRSSGCVDGLTCLTY